jgi:hypothetical protein
MTAVITICDKCHMLAHCRTVTLSHDNTKNPKFVKIANLGYAG